MKERVFEGFKAPEAVCVSDSEFGGAVYCLDDSARVAFFGEEPGDNECFVAANSTCNLFDGSDL